MRVAKPAVGFGFDQSWTFAPARAPNGALNRAAHGKHVHAIHHFARNAVGAGAIGDVRQLAHLGPGNRHGIQVVLGDEDHGQVPQARHIQGLMEIAGVGGPVAEEAQHDAIRALQLLRQCGTHCDRDVPAHNAGRAQVAMDHVSDVHRAALALAVATRAAQHFGHHLVVVFLFAFRRLGGLVAVGVRVSVAAVRAGDQIVVTKRGDRSDGDGLLSRVKVGCTFQYGLAQQLGDVVLKGPNFHHLAQIREQLVTRQALFLNHGRNLLRQRHFNLLFH